VKLEGKIAVVTGGTSGIGLAAARRFVDEGAHVYITGRNQERLDKAVAEIGSGVTGVRADSSSAADLDRLYAQIADEQGRVDVVFANAGIGEYASLGEVTEEHFRQIVDVNLLGTLFTVQKALPLLPDEASVILTGSIASIKGFPQFGVYNATKAAIRSFARTWANELKDRKIRVNVIAPGTIDTPVFEYLEGKDQFVSLIPRGEIGRPEEVANVALFLASDESSFVNGIELFVDGATVQI
jgi:NAD(P)-dependent dehydrogenase (short-subunit alcohol dehydrogenase family)